MSRDPRYQRLLNSRRWAEVKRLVWQRAGGLCEQCREEGLAAGVPGGYVRPGVDCHHVRPIEGTMTDREMERLCYDPGNVRLLCIPCHVRVHKELRSHCAETVAARRAQGVERWRERMLAKFSGGDGGRGGADPGG